MPEPEYPECARQARLGGLVAIYVLVDESGVVVSVQADQFDQHRGKNADGAEVITRKADRALVEAAEAAARQATFRPFHIKSVAVQFSGELIYNFVADNGNLPPQMGKVYGPMLNGRAVTIPQPDWPVDLRLLYPTDTVTVDVTIDETGKVISATAIGGSPLLRPAAEAAARKAEFSPWLIMNEPVRTGGLITYTFPLKKP